MAIARPHYAALHNSLVASVVSRISHAVRRFIALIVLVVLLVLTLSHQKWPRLRKPGLEVTFIPLGVPDPAVQKSYFGAFTLEQTWHLVSDWRDFGSYSALFPLEGGRRLVAIGDQGNFLNFPVPDRLWLPGDLDAGAVLKDGETDKKSRDMEAAAYDPESQRVWIALEYRNAIMRFKPDWEPDGMVQPAAMAHWPDNEGPEAFTRLADGRFITICECTASIFADGSYPGVLFAGDPVDDPDAAMRFTAHGPEGFRPTDMAQLPDGRVLVLMRKVIWPVPLRFAGRIAIGDPREIRPGGVLTLRTVAHLPSTLPIDNFEGMAIVPRQDGTVTVWLISDENNMKMQRSLLWKLRVDPAQLR